MQKYTKLEKGTFVKNGKEYDYEVEIADDFPLKKEGNVRLRIIEERPAIHKVRTRYDPEIEMYGDKNASMELTLGYNMKEVKSTLKHLIFTIISPFYFVGIAMAFIFIDKLPKGFIPGWGVWIAIPLLIILTGWLFYFYYRINIMTLAQYLKARDMKKILKQEGFKQ